METGLTTQTQQPSPLADIRSMAMLAPAESMQQGLAEYAAKRRTFRDWLRHQMQEGVHFGFPPGCRAEDKGAAWQSKPSLYKAGAEFVVDLMGLRAEYASDETTWRMLGQPKDTYFRVCTLVSRQNGEVIGSGTGARKNGDKRMDTNASLKMADKSALVAAVLNAYGLSDLFTQDIEDQQQPNARPDARSDAPQQAARADRVTKDELTRLIEAWKARFTHGEDDAGLKAKFGLWVAETTNDHIKGTDALRLPAWDRDSWVYCLGSLDIEEVPY